MNMALIIRNPDDCEEVKIRPPKFLKQVRVGANVPEKLFTFSRSLSWYRRNTARVYSDGAANSNGVAAAAVLFSDGRRYQTARKIEEWSADLMPSSIAEAGGVLLALLLIRDYLKISSAYSSFTVFTDSVNTINRIEEKQKWVKAHLKIIESLEAQSISVSFVYVPAHCGIKGNEIADDLASKASKGEYFQNFVPSKGFFILDDDSVDL